MGKCNSRRSAKPAAYCADGINDGAADGTSHCAPREINGALHAAGEGELVPPAYRATARAASSANAVTEPSDKVVGAAPGHPENGYGPVLLSAIGVGTHPLTGAPSQRVSAAWPEADRAFGILDPAMKPRDADEEVPLGSTNPTGSCSQYRYGCSLSTVSRVMNRPTWAS